MIFPGRKLNTISDEALLSLIQSGHQGASSELYNRYSQRVLHYLYRMLGYNEQLAQDFMQETFIKVLNNIERFKRT